MKRTMVLLLALTLLLGLTACKTEQLASVQSPKEDFANTGTNIPENASKEEADATVADKVTVQVQTVTRDERDAQARPLLNTAVAKASVLIAERPEAQDAVNAALLAQYERYEADADAYRQQAQADLADENRQLGDLWGGYGLESTVTVGRADARVISIAYRSVSFTGGSHPNENTVGLTYDAQTGQPLRFDALADDVARFEEVVAQALAAQLRTKPYADIVYEDAALHVDTVLDEQIWYLSAQGLEILSSPYVLAPHAAGTLRFTITYAALKDILLDKWLPQPTQADAAGLRLTQTAAENTDVVCADAAGQTVLLTTDAVVENVRVGHVSMADDGTFVETEHLYAASHMDKGDTLALTALLPEGAPNLTISCTLADGQTKAYAIGESGKDGSLLLLDLTDAWRSGRHTK